MNKKVLLIEDSPEVFQMVQAVTSSIADVSWAKDLSEATKLLSEKKFHLILLDLNLPDGNGINLCAKIQANDPHTQIFILSAEQDLSQKVLGFSAGADDYITKPFQPLELKARIEAKFRKMDLMAEELLCKKWKELEIIQNRQEVKILENNILVPIDLTSLEYKLLLYFADKPGEVFNREKILNDIWGENIYVYSRSVDTHISKLRKKLRSVAHVIESVHGVGYKFNPSN